MQPQELKIEDFNYHLPSEKIAVHPLAKRDESKLLIYKNEKITEDYFYNLHEWLPSSSLIIFNNTKVVEARMVFKTSLGASIEIFCLEPATNSTDITIAMQQTNNIRWKCFIGNNRKWKEETIEKTIVIHDKELLLTARRIEKAADAYVIDFFWNDAVVTFADILHAVGTIPLPPYLNRTAEKEDAERYQTVYAKTDGSVAAPTAGLHFTDELLDKLSTKNIKKDFVTLHVGAGTFKPVKAETIGEHEMHSELFEAHKEVIENLINNLSNKIIVVGTTSLRTIESLYWMGCNVINKKSKTIKEISVEDISIQQWNAYEINNNNISAKESLHALLLWMNENNIDKLIAKTQIIIAPPYKMQIANALITNFHQPKSTLLLLVAAVAGDKWKDIYEYALQHNFRFLSYGDSCLIFNKENN